MFAQFLLRDIEAPADNPGRDYQTGILYSDGRPKPAAMAFKLPLFASPNTAPDGTRGLVLFGGVRPGATNRVVRVERRAIGSRDWLPVATVGDSCDEESGAFLTGSDGFFRRTAAWDGPADYRLVWDRLHLQRIRPPDPRHGQIPDRSWAHGRMTRALPAASLRVMKRIHLEARYGRTKKTDPIFFAPPPPPPPPAAAYACEAESWSRSSRFSSLPEAFLGSSSTKCTDFGTLSRRAAPWRGRSGRPRSRRPSGTTTAAIASIQRSCGRPITATSPTAG